MKWHYLILIFLLTQLRFSLVSQPVTITGSAPGAEGKNIEVTGFGDLITFREKTIARSTVDSSGKYQLIFDLPKTQYIVLSIDFHRVELFLEPSRTYYINIAPMNYNDLKEVNPLIQSQNLEVEFQQYDPNELNSLVKNFDILYNNFLLKNFNALYRDRDKSKIDTFRVQIVTSFLDVSNSYFANYIKYKIAGLEQVSQTLNQAQLGKKYFADSPILYENLEYMDFFTQYFTKYITATSKAVKYTDYNTILNSTASYEKMMKALKADTILKKDQLRELVMLKELMEMYNTSGYNKANILSLLKTVSTQSAFPENRQVAENIIIVLTNLKPGSDAPDFSLQDRDHNLVSLKSLNGKPVVLNFWTTYCLGCVTEMDYMKPLYDKYKENITFVSISADKDYRQMINYISNKKDFVWNFLHIGDDVELLKEYDVRSYPLFVILDKEGKIYRYPADLPSAGLEASLIQLLNP